MASPFDDPQDLQDPFQDPSITTALTSGHNTHEPAYQQNAKFPEPDYTVTSYTAYDEPSFNASSSTAPTSSNHNLSTREEELLRKERELEAREQELQQHQQNSSRRTVKNFPPFFPLIYLEISAEIPRENQAIMELMYKSWLGTLAALVWNTMVLFILLFSHPPDVTWAAADFGVALSYCFTITLASFFLWYRVVYNAYMKEVSLYYSIYFFFNGFHFLFCLYMGVGVPSSGGAGLILTITLFQAGYILSGIFSLTSCIAWFGIAGLTGWLYKETYEHYKAAGHTFSDAKKDAITRIGRSGATEQVAGAYVRAQSDRFV